MIFFFTERNSKNRVKIVYPEFSLLQNNFLYQYLLIPKFSIYFYDKILEQSDVDSSNEIFNLTNYLQPLEK